MRLASALATALLLTGCAATTEIRAPLLKDLVPKEMLKCAAEPNGSKVVTSRQAAAYIVDLKASGRDCRSKLHGVGQIIEGEKR